MKEYRVEFIFIGIIILGLAIWKISEMVKTRCYQKQSIIYEGFLTAEAANAATRDTSSGLTNGSSAFLSEVQNIVKKNNTEILSTENFTVNTPEYEMTQLH